MRVDIPTEGSKSNTIRTKILDMLGFGVWENVLDNNTLQLRGVTNKTFAEYKREQ